MSVNHRLLPINDKELASILQTPPRVRDLVELRETDVVDLMTEGVAIVALTATSDKDPLAFLRFGTADAVSGWVGRYSEEDDRVVECEVDMGYGPASYYRNNFLLQVAQRLAPITSDVFAASMVTFLISPFHSAQRVRMAKNSKPGSWATRMNGTRS